MKTIFKYELQIDDEQSIEMPKDAEIISLQVQHGVPCIWAIVDTDKEKESRVFHTYGTGQKFYPKGAQFVGTYLIHQDRLVYHVFDIH